MSMPALEHAPTSRYDTDEERWSAVVARDPNAEDEFVYAVRSTGVYCRPTCAARPAKRRNVTFFATAAEAERAGFRPCKRCRPDRESVRARQARLVAQACETIAKSVEPPNLDALARAAGLSRFHFHRLFKQMTGLTPKAYATAHRTQRVQQELAQGARVTDAIYAASE
jgi:AraC family transcriptional regulator of adaptative response/methylated-DNA-[protein]-cysteine methyltransferase